MIAPEGKHQDVQHSFISGDFSTVRGTKEVAAKIKDWAGEAQVDILFQTQGTYVVYINIARDCCQPTGSG